MGSADVPRMPSKVTPILGGGAGPLTLLELDALAGDGGIDSDDALVVEYLFVFVCWNHKFLKICPAVSILPVDVSVSSLTNTLD